MARQAGVSLTTASRALNEDNRHPVSTATRQRVVEAALHLGYVPNLMARGLRTRRQPTIAVLVHDITDPYFAEIVRGVTEAASREGFLTVVCSSGRDPATELRYVEMLRLSRVNALLFAGGGLEDRAYQRELRRHTAQVRAYGGAVVALAPRAEAWPAEVADNRGGVELALDHLRSLGHSRMAMISGPAHLRTALEREQPYLELMAGLRLPAPLARGDYTRGGGAAAMAELLAGDPSFTAVVVSNDAMAIGALAELRRQGLAVPDRLSVVGFDDVPGLAYMNPALTTVRVPMAEIGAAGVARALAELAGSRGGPRVRVHPVELVARESTAPPHPMVALA